MGYTRLDAQRGQNKLSRPLVHLGLFAATFVTCLMAGTQFMMQDPLAIENWSVGLTYAVLILSFLAAHEFGHYVAARIHGVDATLPYFIPIPPTLMLFGTFGALIRTRSAIQSRTVLFDIGVSGPLAGFLVCVVILGLGLVFNPGPALIAQVHGDVVSASSQPAMTFGDSLFLIILRAVTQSNVYWPPMTEIYHYPFLCVGWFGLFVTALNMLPFGQLDGGHVLYALIGRKQHAVGRFLWWLLFALVILSMLAWVQSELESGYYEERWIQWMENTIQPTLTWAVQGAPWLFNIGGMWAFWMIFIRFFIRIEHPVLENQEPLGPARTVVGWLAVLILILCFPPQAIYFG